MSQHYLLRKERNDTEKKVVLEDFDLICPDNIRGHQISKKTSRDSVKYMVVRSVAELDVQTTVYF